MVLLPMVEPAGPQQSVEAFLTSARYRATYDAERAAMQRQLQAAEARAVRAESRANNSEATLAQLLASKRARVSKDSWDGRRAGRGAHEDNWESQISSLIAFHASALR